MNGRALIAVADDSRAAVYGEILASEGLDVFRVPDGYQACNYLRTGERICLLVTELSLPRIDGFGLLRRLQRSQSAGIPVLVTTAFAEMRATAMRLRDELGISALVPATSPRDTVRDVVRRILEGEEDIVETASVLEELESNDHAERADRAERRRLQSIEDVGLLQPHDITDWELNAIVRRVSFEFEVPVALISIVLRDRQWFKARVGTEMVETPLDVSFCRHVVAAKEPLIVPDAHAHPTFAASDLVTSSVVRGYAGVPLLGADGEAWGTLCVIDPERPLQLSARDLRKLVDVARKVVAEIEAHSLKGGMASCPPAPESGFRLRW